MSAVHRSNGTATSRRNVSGVMRTACYVHCKRPRVLCDKCGTVQVNAPFERKNSRFTLLFEGYAMLLLQDIPRAGASHLLRCDEKSLAAILTYWVHDAVNRMDLSDTCSIAMDETTFRRGHKYVTVAVRRRVFDVEPGRDKTAAKNVGEKLERNGGNTKSVNSLTSDMSASYLSAVREVFPNAKQTIDKFHVKQVPLKALDTVRKDEQKESGRKKELFLCRKLFMVPQGRMTDKQRTMATELSKQYKKTGRAFRIVQSLDDFYASTSMDEAQTRLDKLCSWMRRCRLKPMKDAALTLRNHSKEIRNYFHTRLTNAICEGINAMIQAAKRKARGFHAFEGYAAMIYLVAGKLELDTPVLLWK
ncbi:ISL3 family transposase [Selenomonas timonae]|uniref:ISL3 family transposase n=1 Tax=Selenomonas timonae TaxID=2754044 RepID=A0A7G7VH54_9FIRM|nr:ISL3 family transposase [Selenomonas timonae]